MPEKSAVDLGATMRLRALAVLPLLLFALCAPAAQAAQSVSSESPDTGTVSAGATGRTVVVRDGATSRTDLHTGDRIIDERGVGAEVPPAGMSVAATHSFTDGSDSTMVIATTQDGKAGVLVGDAATIAKPSARHRTQYSDPNGCDDSTWAQMSVPGGTPFGTWQTTMNWYIKTGSIPTGYGLDPTNTVTAIRNAGSDWANVNDGCGVADANGLSLVYQGSTTLNADMDSSGSTCNTTPNGVSSVGFGPLASGVLGTTCVWANGAGRITESDNRLNNSGVFWWNTPTSCVSSFLVESVMAHERGHSWGFAHLAGHPYLTMFISQGYCDTSPETLGLGDANGVNAIY